MRQSSIAFLIFAMLASSAAALADAPTPLYKPSSRSPEPLDIRTNAYGFSASAPQALEIGDIAPDFEVENPDGERISSAKLRADGPLAIVFYRGHW